MDKPLIKQMEDSIPTTSDVSEGMSNATKSITDTFTNAKENIQSSLKDFSSKSVINAGSEFLNANGLLAKFAFVILVFLIFLLVLKLSVSIIAYFLAPARNPYIVRGLLPGTEEITITQNPADANAVTTLLSNDRYTGAEFTWTVWLKLKSDTSSTYGLKHVFSKGENQFYNTSVRVDNQDISGRINTLNSPGLYLQKYDASMNGDSNPSATSTTQYKLVMLMDHIVQDSNSTYFNVIVVPSIPINKWVHVAIRLENMILDIYVNGTIVKRTTLSYAPKQNYSNILVHGNGGFNGDLSNLKYYNYALNVFEINNIILFGPDTSSSKLSSSYGTTNSSYLSSNWYMGQQT